MKALRPHVMQRRCHTQITGHPWFARMAQASENDIREGSSVGAPQSCRITLSTLIRMITRSWPSKRLGSEPYRRASAWMWSSAG